MKQTIETTYTATDGTQHTAIGYVRELSIIQRTSQGVPMSCEDLRIAEAAIKEAHDKATK